jgi:hypothetical protein
MSEWLAAVVAILKLINLVLTRAQSAKDEGIGYGKAVEEAATNVSSIVAAADKAAADSRAHSGSLSADQLRDEPDPYRRD